MNTIYFNKEDNQEVNVDVNPLRRPIPAGWGRWYLDQPV